MFIQLASLPIFLSRWTTEKYGYWLMISAIPTYLTLADVGILTASGNMMAMHQARQESAELNAVFRCTLFVILVLVLGGLFLGQMVIEFLRALSRGHPG